jgi:sugar phosphate isomerase/epimerase
MQLGFVSAILGDLDLGQVLEFAAAERFDCVELMCWPPGKANRRYAGVCHIDVTNLGDQHVRDIHTLVARTGVTISGLGYYPNPLDPDSGHREQVAGHLRLVIDAAVRLGIGVVNTFIGRDWTKSIDDNWSILQQVWPPLVRHAESRGVRLGIENCPMLFSKDEWPGGKNLAVSPAVWRRLFSEIPSPHLGLNFDPSHLIFQFIDYERCLREFASRLVHFHAKDTRIDRDKLYEVGALGLGWHTPKLPGLGDVNWARLFSALTDAGYSGPICIEVEDRAYEGSLKDRQRALRQSAAYLRQYVS